MYYRLVLGALCLAYFCYTNGVAAQTHKNFLAGLSTVELQIRNHTKDGCWPNPRETSEQLTLELVRSKLAVKEKQLTIISFRVMGMEIQRNSGQGLGMCTVAYELEVDDCATFKTSFSSAAKFGCFTIWSSKGFYMFDKDNAQNKVNGFASKKVKSFLYDLEMDRQGKTK